MKLTKETIFNTACVAGASIFFIVVPQLKANYIEAQDQTQPEPEPDAFVVNDQNVAMLAVDCEQKQIRPSLKDPNSFRSLGHTYKETVDQIYVQVNYTATNSFGGRVQNSQVCKYTL